MIKPCQVWVRSLGSIATKVRVVGVENAMWLRESLQHSGVECTEPMEIRGSPVFTFRALHVNGIDHVKLTKIMKQVSEIELMFEPA